MRLAHSVKDLVKQRMGHLVEHHTLLSLTIIVDGIVGGGTVLRAVVALSKHGNDRAAVCPCRTRFLWGGGG